jgi:polar amino acid transport system substrate-binding protein
MMTKKILYGLLMVFILSIVGCSTKPVQPIASEGKLRMGLFRGSPTSILPGKSLSDSKGVGLELGQALANDFGFTFVPVIFQTSTDAIGAIKKSRVDMVFISTGADHTDELVFSRPILQLEQSYLVGNQGRIRSLAVVDVPSRKIGVMEGSSSLNALKKTIKHGQIITISSVTSAAAMLRADRIDAFLSNRALLNEMVETVPGSRVLPDVIGYESFSLGLPKARADSLPQINQWIEELLRKDQLKGMIENAGLQGAVPRPIKK